MLVLLKVQLGREAIVRRRDVLMDSARWFTRLHQEDLAELPSQSISGISFWRRYLVGKVQQAIEVRKILELTMSVCQGYERL